MTIDLFVRYFHFLGIFVWVGALGVEAALLADQLSRRMLKQLLRIDRVYGLAAIIVVATGLLQWFVVGKPADFYTPNPLFHLKVGLAILVGLLSIYPSLFFSKNSKGDDSETMTVVPKSVHQLVYLQLLIMAFVPLLAVLMAMGV